MPDSLSRLFTAGDASQDQEIARGVDWFTGSDPEAVQALWDVLNDRNHDGIRGLSDDELNVVCAIALIGFWEIARATRLELEGKAE